LRFGQPKLSFRIKVLLLAAILVTAIQLITLWPTLRAVAAEQRSQADRSVELGGAVFDEYMRHRNSTLISAIRTLVMDFPFRQAIGGRDEATIQSALANHAARMEMPAAAIFDLDGSLIASIGGGRALWPGAAMQRAALDSYALEANPTEPVISIGFIDGKPYHTVSLVVQAPTPIAWATFGLPIDSTLAEELKKVTLVETSILDFRRREVYATTLADDLQAPALSDVRLSMLNDVGEPTEQGGWFTRLRPYLDEADGIYVALQLPLMEARARYIEMRDRLIAVSVAVLVLTLAAAVGLSQMVTRPIGRLVEAAQRMAEGIYNKPLAITSDDEFAVLAQGFNSMQEAISKREQDIVHMAHHDSLSGLPTREIVVSEMREAIENVDQLAVINFVLYRFEELASSLGHRTADRLIQLAAGRLRDRLRDGELLGHLNHQEFVLVLPEANLADAQTRVLEVQSLLRSGISVGDANISMQIRAGVALYPQHGINASELLRCAGISRGHARHHFGSMGVYEPGQEQQSLELIRIVGDFPRALQNRELSVEFQPKVDCNSLTVTGAEALVRWDHPELGRVAPDRFIGAIEQAGGIVQLTRWVLAEAIRTLAEWRARGFAISVAVNISADDLLDDSIVHLLQQLSGDYQVEPGRITLEVTESAIMHDIEHSLAVIRSIRALGFRVAIDDFGTGHSALAQLKRLPVDELKIDREFVLNMADPRDEAVVRTAIELAHKFGLTVVAEGVETEAALTRLQQLGCETAQGFFFARSLTPEAFVQWVGAWERGGGADIVNLVGVHAPGRQA
jgi:diguanylate cyclase (GGDEF)-like protein